MNCIFQIIRRDDGVRSPPAEAGREAFGAILREMLEKHPDKLKENDYVLVIFEQNPGDEDSARVSQAPILTVSQFLTYFTGASRDG